MDQHHRKSELNTTFKELIHTHATQLSLDEFFEHMHFDANSFFGNDFWSELNRLDPNVFFHIVDPIIDMIGYKKSETSSGQYSHRTHLIDCIKTNFIVNEDYTIIKKSDFDSRDANVYRNIFTHEILGVKNETRGGALRNELFMKRDSFKELLMIVRTQHSRTIYKYLIAYGNHVEMYKRYQYEFKDHENEHLQRENVQLKACSDTPRPLNIFQQNMLANLLKEEELYIITSKKYAQQYLFKIGRSCNSKTRCQQMNTSRVLDDETLYVCHISKTYDVDNCEKHIHSLLESVRFKENREFFMSPFHLLRDLMDTVTSSYGIHNSKLDDIINKLNSIVLSSINTDIPDPIVSMTDTIKKIKAVDNELTDLDRKDCLKEIMNEHYNSVSVIYWIEMRKHIETKLNRKLRDIEAWKYSIKNTSHKHLCSRIKWTKHVPALPLTNTTVQPITDFFRV